MSKGARLWRTPKVRWWKPKMSVLAIQEGSQSSRMLVLTNLLEWRNVGKDSKVHEARIGGRPWLIQYWVRSESMLSVRYWRVEAWMDWKRWKMKQ